MSDHLVYENEIHLDAPIGPDEMVQVALMAEDFNARARGQGQIYVSPDHTKISVCSPHPFLVGKITDDVLETLLEGKDCLIPPMKAYVASPEFS